MRCRWIICSDLVEVGLAIHTGVEPEMPLHRLTGEHRLRVREVLRTRSAVARGSATFGSYVPSWSFSCTISDAVTVDEVVAEGGRDSRRAITDAGIGNDDLVDVGDHDDGVVPVEQVVLQLLECVTHPGTWSTVSWETGIRTMSSPHCRPVAGVVVEDVHVLGTEES